MRKLIVIICCVLLCSSCIRPALFDQMDEIPSGAWSVKDTLHYHYMVRDTLASYDVFFMIRHNGDYPFQNLIFFVSIAGSNHSIMRDTASFLLADEMGRWSGKGFGSIWSNKLLYRSRVRFSKAGEYTIQLVHGMRPYDLLGIEDAGIRIENADK